jgi:hypothetical protein
MNVIGRHFSLSQQISDFIDTRNHRTLFTLSINAATFGGHKSRLRLPFRRCLYSTQSSRNRRLSFR